MNINHIVKEHRSGAIVNMLLAMSEDENNDELRNKIIKFINPLLDDDEEHVRTIIRDVITDLKRKIPARKIVGHIFVGYE